MKKLYLFVIILHISFLVFATNNQWNKEQKTGEESFLVVFDLTDSDHSDLYSDIGFSRTPLSNGSYTTYEGGTLTMEFEEIDTNGSTAVAKMSASTYAYWHVVVGSGTKIYLKISPKPGAVVGCKFYGYTDENKNASKTETGLVSSETEVQLLVINKIGRILGSTEINIEAKLSNYYYTDDIICNLTLVTKTI